MDILLRLKTETRPEHDELEKRLNLIRGDMTLDDYIFLLKKFYSFYHTLENKYPFDQERLKTPKIKEDLNALGFHNTSDLPACDLPDLKNSSMIMGMNYVVEGSTLGGMVLTKHFSKLFHFSGTGISFFSGYGPHTMEMWTKTRVRISTFALSKDCNEDDVIEGAKITFQSLSHWLLSE